MEVSATDENLATSSSEDLSPIHDLETLLRTLEVTESPGEWCVVSIAAPPIGVEVRASVVESEGTSYVIATTAARDLGIEPTFVGVWLTLEVNSALDSVGLTAAVAAVSSKAGICCNVFAGYHHDHLLVPATESARAIASLKALRNAHQGDKSIDDPTAALTTLT